MRPCLERQTDRQRHTYTDREKGGGKERSGEEKELEEKCVDTQDYLIRGGCTQNTVTSVGEDVKELEPSFIAGRNVKWCSCYGKQFGFPKMLNLELAYDLAIPFLAIYPKEMKTSTQKHVHDRS